MSQNRLARQQTKAVEGFGIGMAEAFKDMAMSPVTFAAMRLDMAAAFDCQFAQPVQGCIGAGRNKTWRDDRQHTSVSICGMRADMLDHCARLGDGGFS